MGESKVITVTFDPAYHPDAHSRTIDTKLTISYREHPHVVSVWWDSQIVIFSKTEKLQVTSLALQNNLCLLEHDCNLFGYLLKYIFTCFLSNSFDTKLSSVH